MTALRPFLIAVAATIALAAASLATANDAAARGRYGHAAGPHLTHQHRFHLQQFRHHRRHQGYFFTRFKPCLVWTRQGWTNTCGIAR